MLALHQAELAISQDTHKILHTCSLNILLDSAGVAKLADFGLAERLMTTETSPDGRADSNGTTWPWAAPEVLLHHRTSRKADVYSFAVVVWEIFTAYGNGKVSSTLCACANEVMSCGPGDATTPFV